MAIIFADVSLAIKSVSTEIKYAVKSSRLSANAMSKGSAICEEFCDEVVVGSRVLELDSYDLIEIEEIKCTLSIVHFTGLTERMVQEGYCCSQVQRDIKGDKCFAWFEPATCHFE
jgi:hypothetical protein